MPKEPVLTCFGHLIHFIVLLAPTIVVMPELLCSWPYLLFASTATGAAIVENRSLSTQDTWTPNSGIVSDPRALRVAQLVGLVLAAAFWSAQAEAMWRGPRFEPLLGGCGLVLAMIGIGLRAAAMRALGKYFISDIRVERIVRTGIYRWFRHPSEIGLIMIGVGVPLLLGSTVSALLALLLLTPISLWRIGREELVLRLAENESRD